MQLESLVVIASIVLALLACFSQVSVYAQETGRNGRPVTIENHDVERGIANADPKPGRT